MASPVPLSPSSFAPRTPTHPHTQGRVGAQFWAAYVPCSTQYADAVRATIEQIDVIKRMCAKYSDAFEFVTTADGINAAFGRGKIGGLIGP